jgi:hypothetical protein
VTKILTCVTSINYRSNRNPRCRRRRHPLAYLVVSSDADAAGLVADAAEVSRAAGLVADAAEVSRAAGLVADAAEVSRAAAGDVIYTF